MRGRSTCNTTTGICGAAIEATTAPADTTDTTTLTELPQTGIDEDIIRIVGGMTLVIIGFVLYRKLNIKQ
ncbi:MAG TPA: LPXTG cell wall anchor domain-containing protein [bacterium]|nr:LPXTG cell wall anchor domain-containing protein [bacterium]